MKKKFDNNLVILIVIIFLASYVRLINLTQPIWPDEALYAKTAENLYNGNGLTFDGTPWNNQPPFFVLIVTLAYAIFGVSEISARIVGSLFGILGIIAVYYLGKYLYNEKVGIIAAFFLSVTPVHWFLSRMILTDMILTTLLTLVILFFYISTERDRRYTWMAGVLIGLVCLTKRIGPIIYLILGSYLIASERNFEWIKKKELQTIFGISIFMQIPWEIIKFVTLSRFSNTPITNISRFSTKSQSAGIFTIKGVLTVLKALPFTVSKPVLLLVPLGIFFMIKSKKKEDILAITPVLIFLLVLMSWFSSWYRVIEPPRYLIPTVPFLCIISAHGIYNISERIKIRAVYTFFIIILVLFTIVVNVNLGKKMALTEFDRYRGYDDVSMWIDQNTLQDSIIVTNSRILRYYSNRNLIYYPSNETNFQKSLENRTDDVYMVIDSRKRISPPYIIGYIKENQELVQKVAAFDTGQRSNLEVYSMKKGR